MSLNPSSKNAPSATDLQLTTAIRDALTQYTPTRIWEQRIEISAHEGEVTLLGITRNRSAKQTAERIARQVKGVSKLQNQIIADDDVEVALAQALAADAQTCNSFPGIIVGVVFGVAYLKGTVTSNQIKQAASQVANQVPGVQRVSNELIVQ